MQIKLNVIIGKTDAETQTLLGSRNLRRSTRRSAAIEKMAINAAFVCHDLQPYPELACGHAAVSRWINFVEHERNICACAGFRIVHDGDPPDLFAPITH